MEVGFHQANYSVSGGAAGLQQSAFQLDVTHYETGWALTCARRPRSRWTRTNSVSPVAKTVM